MTVEPNSPLVSAKSLFLVVISPVKLLYLKKQVKTAYILTYLLIKILTFSFSSSLNSSRFSKLIAPSLISEIML